mmetsp:Transcript_81746/g.229285  ORF Transcript_81746/g.229285 Transcript_81746/m.229285 type:complete len:328 (-) Transcript_81746:9-992(-)
MLCEVNLDAAALRREGRGRGGRGDRDRGRRLRRLGAPRGRREAFLSRQQAVQLAHHHPQVCDGALDVGFARGSVWRGAAAEGSLDAAQHLLAIAPLVRALVEAGADALGEAVLRQAQAPLHGLHLQLQLVGDRVPRHMGPRLVFLLGIHGPAPGLLVLLRMWLRHCDRRLQLERRRPLGRLLVGRVLHRLGHPELASRAAQLRHHRGVRLAWHRPQVTRLPAVAVAAVRRGRRVRPDGRVAAGDAVHAYRAVQPRNHDRPRCAARGSGRRRRRHVAAVDVAAGARGVEEVLVAGVAHLPSASVVVGELPRHGALAIGGRALAGGLLV